MIESRSSRGIELQTLLKIASCLGQIFEPETLPVAVRSLVEMDEFLSVNDAVTVTNSIPACIQLGLIERLGTNYRVPHDQIQASSFRLITQDELPKLQFTIGRGLANHITTGSNKDKTKDDLLYLSTDLCNRGRSLITSGMDRISLAFQNLRAAEKAIHQSSAFDAAIAYAKSGLLCLEEPEPLATEKYLVKCLRLKLHTVWAEAAYCIGDHHATATYSTKVFDSDFPFADRFVGYSIPRMMTQFATAQVDASTETSVFILKKLNCINNLPTHPGTMRVLTEIMKTKNLMKFYTKEDLLNLPLMTDEKRLFKTEDRLGSCTLPRFFGTQALAYIALAQEGKRVRHNLTKARGVMKMLRKWLAGGNTFLNHFICLMKAEIAAVL